MSENSMSTADALAAFRGELMAQGFDDDNELVRALVEKAADTLMVEGLSVHPRKAVSA